jgi:hypothetical protein
MKITLLLYLPILQNCAILLAHCSVFSSCFFILYSSTDFLLCSLQLFSLLLLCFPSLIMSLFVHVPDTASRTSEDECKWY